MYAAANDPIGNCLYFYGHCQDDLALCIKRVVQPGWSVVDLGANIGIFTILLGRLVGRDGHVTAVEPGTRTHDYLIRNIETARLRQNVRVYNVAVGSYDGTAFFRENNTGKIVDLGGARVVSDIKKHQDCRKITMRTLDSIWEEEGRPEWKFIKMDVEGCELNVLQGARKLFANQPPVACSVEFNIPYLSQQEGGWESLWSFFTDRGYQPLSLKLQPIDKPVSKMSDVLFCANCFEKKVSC